MIAVWNRREFEQTEKKILENNSINISRLIPPNSFYLVNKKRGRVWREPVFQKRSAKPRVKKTVSAFSSVGFSKGSREPTRIETTEFNLLGQPEKTFLLLRIWPSWILCELGFTVHLFDEIFCFSRQQILTTSSSLRPANHDQITYLAPDVGCQNVAAIAVCLRKKRLLSITKHEIARWNGIDNVKMTLHTGERRHVWISWSVRKKACRQKMKTWLFVREIVTILKWRSSIDVGMFFLNGASQTC